ncbi:MAG: hypothetical protein COA79_22505 [Planctomycetota bacterium]|nr:MAG: hypothetical protein COA79_22505 [Planctomycetota bacterium]
MSIVTVFTMPTMTSDMYNQSVKELENAGLGEPKGRLYHVSALQEDGSVIVTDVWESSELLDEFSKTLMPILEKIGVELVAPFVSPVINIIN